MRRKGFKQISKRRVEEVNEKTSRIQKLLRIAMTEQRIQIRLRKKSRKVTRRRLESM